MTIRDDNMHMCVTLSQAWHAVSLQGLEVLLLQILIVRAEAAAGPRGRDDERHYAAEVDR